MNRFEDICWWAEQRNLIEGSNNRAQFLKLVEEVGELAMAIAKNDHDGFIDSIGDIVVVLTIMAKQKGVDMNDCIEAAWDEIKDRKGKMVNGVFVKEAK